MDLLKTKSLTRHCVKRVTETNKIVVGHGARYMPDGIRLKPKNKIGKRPPAFRYRRRIRVHRIRLYA